MNKFKAKLCYAFGDVYGGGATLVFNLLYMNFLILIENIPVLYATVIILIGKLWDAVTDPIMGRMSDSTRSRFGRRRIYFLIGIIPVILSFIMLFYSFGIQSIAGKTVYHCFAYMFFGTALTIVMIPYNAVLSDITSDYNERTSFTTVRMMMSGAAALVCAVVPNLIIKSIGGDVNGPAQKKGYLAMAVILSIIFGICWLLTFLGTKERKDLPPPEKNTLRDFFSALKSKPYRNYLGIFIAFQIAIDLVLALFIFYVDLVILRYKSYELLVGALLVSSIVFLLLQSGIAKKKGKVFPLFIGFPIWIATALMFIFVTRDTPIYVLVIFAVLIAVGASAGNLSVWSMLTDIFDIDEIVTGKRREGIFSGMTTFMGKFSSGVSIFILGAGLKLFGFDQNTYNRLRSSAEDFDPAAYAANDVVAAVKWLFIIIPVVMLAICLLFALKTKIGKRRFDTVLKGVESIKTSGGLAALTPEEINDIETAAGVKKEQLWGGTLDFGEQTAPKDSFSV